MVRLNACSTLCDLYASIAASKKGLRNHYSVLPPCAAVFQHTYTAFRAGASVALLTDRNCSHTSCSGMLEGLKLVFLYRFAILVPLCTLS